MFGTERVAAENREYQRRLAASLIGTMGIEGALQTCLAHGWEGVIENVLCHADRGDGRGRGPARGPNGDWPGGFAIRQRPVCRLTP